MKATILTFLIAAAGVQPSSLGAADQLAVRVSPSLSMAPADVVIAIRVESHPDNRFVMIEAESDAAYRSSVEQLDGAAAARTRFVRWRGLPGGEYAIRTTLVRAGGERVVAQAQMRVIPAGPE